MTRSILLKTVILVAMCSSSSGCGDDAFLDVLDKLPQIDEQAEKAHRRHTAIHDACKARCDRHVACEVKIPDGQGNCVAYCIEELYEIESEGLLSCTDRILELNSCVARETSCEEFKAWNDWAEQDDDIPPPPICQAEFQITQATCG